MERRKKVTLKDVLGINKDYKPIEGRFKEIISTQKIIDTTNNIEYDGLVDTELLIVMNQLSDEILFMKKCLKEELLEVTLTMNNNEDELNHESNYVRFQVYYNRIKRLCDKCNVKIDEKDY